MDSSAPPPPLPPSPRAFKMYSPRSPSSPSSSSLQSVLIIAGIVAICAVASVSIFFLLRFISICRRRRSPSSVAVLPLPLFNHRSSSAVTDSSAATASSCEAPSAALSEKEKAALIQSLPLFSLASSVPALPKTSADCAVCLSPFLPEDDLRLLPACRHAFHASCIEKWLLAGDTPSCPLCRASITLHHLPLLPPAPPETGSSAAISASERSRSGSFRIEIGSVSLRRAPSNGEPGNPSTRLRPPSLPPAVRAYSIDSEWEYLVEEEVEAVVAGIAMPTEKSDKPSEGAAAAAVGAPVAGSGRSSRWLRDYVDRLSSASSSLRFSGRWSNRYDSGGDGGIVVRQPSWHWEGSARRDAAEDGGVFGFYRWLVGAY